VASLRCPSLVGRDAELDVVRAALAAARQGRGAALAVVGEPGLGKSRLAGEVAAVAGRDSPVLVGRAVEDQQAISFRPLVEALLGGLRTAGGVDLAGLGPFRPALGRLLPQLRTEAAGADDSPLVLAEGVLRLLGVLAAGRGLVLVLEDLHWADPDSLVVVEYLVDNLADAPLLLVLTTRDEPGPTRALIRRLVERGSVTVLELAPLSDAAVAQMATACLGQPPDPHLLGVLRGRAEGIPLLVEELLGAGQHLRADAVVPATVAELTRFRLSALPDPARRCVRAAALLGQRFDWRLLPEVTGLDPDAVLQGLRCAVDARLVEPDAGGGFAFRHALTRDAVVTALLPPERVELARHALEAVEAAHPRLDGAWCALAAQLAAAAEDSRRAAVLLLDAGRGDLARGALATAETTLLRARELAADQQRTDVDEALAEVFVLAGQPERAAAVTAELVAVLHAQGAPPRRLAAAHLRLARAWTVAGDWTAAAEQLARVRPLAGEDRELALRADVLQVRVALGDNRIDEAERLAASALAPPPAPVRPR
jgi:AAA ATPase domain